MTDSKRVDYGLWVNLTNQIKPNQSLTIEYPSTLSEFMTSYPSDFSDEIWNAFSPKFGVRYNFNDLQSAYLSYAHGFRPPILDDMCKNGNISKGFKMANQAFAGLIFTPRWLSASLTCRYVGSQWNDDENTAQTQGYFTIDMKASHTFINQLTAGITIQDLLNRQWTDSKGQLSTGRYILLSLSYRFTKK